MTPDEINKKHNDVSWRCFGCKAESGLHWWNGLSVAVCDKTECSQAYVELISNQIQEQRSFDAYIEEHYGGFQ